MSSLKIALDFDDTYTADPAMWLKFVAMAHEFKHKVYVVTMRYPQEGIDPTLQTAVHNRVIYTSRAFKRPFVNENTDVRIDIWIDDRPEWVVGPYDPFKPIHNG